MLGRKARKPAAPVSSVTPEAAVEAVSTLAASGMTVPQAVVAVARVLTPAQCEAVIAWYLRSAQSPRDELVIASLLS